MPADAPPLLDLHDVLVARVDALRAAVPGLDALDVDLWEGGVRVALTVAGQRVALKLRPRDEAVDAEDERAYSRTTSLLAALELPPGEPLARSTERVVQALLRWLERMDQGRLVVRKHAPDDVAPEPAPDAPVAPVVDDPTAIAALRLADLAASDLAGQRALVGGWHLDDTVLVLLAPGAGAPVELVAQAREAGLARVAIGGVDVPAHPALAATLAAARGLDVAVEAGPDADVDALADAGVGTLVVRGDLDVDGLLGRARARGLATVAWLPITAAVVATLADRVAALRAAGADVRLAPPALADLEPDGNPLDLRAAETLDVALTALPLCFAPHRPHVTAWLPAWRLLERGTRFGVVCKFCTARERCPGVDPGHLDRWRTRGMVPVLDV